MRIKEHWKQRLRYKGKPFPQKNIWIILSLLVDKIYRQIKPVNDTKLVQDLYSRNLYAKILPEAKLVFMFWL
jgi:hypothetical protein